LEANPGSLPGFAPRLTSEAVAAPEQQFPQDALDDLSADVRWRLAHRNGCSQLSLAGELDLAAVAELDRAAAGLHTNGGGATTVVDLTRVSFVDSSVIAWLLRLARRVEGAGGDFVVLVERGPVRSTLEISGVCNLMTVFEQNGDGRRSRVGPPGPHADLTGPRWSE
jgi:anti-anti-sigma factor